MISDEAVEAGVKAVFAIREAGTPLLNERDVIRAALEAALPHLLASQGCGTGHSGEQREPAVGATAALAIEDGAPLGFGRLPARVRCRCFKLWVSASGIYYCCKRLAHPQKGGEGC